MLLAIEFGSLKLSSQMIMRRLFLTFYWFYNEFFTVDRLVAVNETREFPYNLQHCQFLKLSDMILFNHP